MKVSAFVLTVLFTVDCVLGLSMTPDSYRNLVERRCFNETVYHEQYVRGQWNPVGSSVDYLIRLIEKIEYHVPDPKILLPMLLRRFHYDNTKQQGYRNFQKDFGFTHRVVNERVFASVPQTPNFPEDILFEDEKCAMFSMLSHTVNETKPRKWTDPNNLFTGNEEFEDKPYPRREVGTLSWANSDYISISTAPMLLGLAVGLFRPGNFSLKPEQPQEIDALIGVTFSDKLALASLASISDYQNLPLFGQDGKWNSTYCQTEYRLTMDIENDRGANVTMAELNGAILGYSLGRKYLYEDDSTPLRKLRLSVILKRFFSRLGLSLDCGLCSQEILTQQLQQDIKEHAVKYLLQWNQAFSYDNIGYERLISFVEYNQMSYWAHIKKASSVLFAECAATYNSIYGSSDCETTSDIFIMLDNTQQYGPFQMEFIKKLLVRIQAANFLGRVTILVNALRSFNSDIIGKMGADLRIQLHLLVYNTSSIQEATCRTAWYTWRESTISDKRLILEHLVSFFERHNITNPHPKVSRNFFWLNMQRRPYHLNSEYDKFTMNRYRWYLKYFLNLRTFFISVNDVKSEDNDILDILLNKDDRIQINVANIHDEQVVSRLAKRVCETPTPLIYQNCDPTDAKRSVWINSSSLITPHRKQYWALYPKHFLNSPMVKLKFRAEGARIRVCLHRFLRPDGDASKCLDAKNDGDTIGFAVETPCRWKRVDNCLPIYFTVQIANKALITPDNCLDDKCRGIEQIVWEMSHSGLECTVGYTLYNRLSTVSGAVSSLQSSRQWLIVQLVITIVAIIAARRCHF